MRTSTLACGALLALAFAFPAVAGDSPVTASNLSFETVASSMTLAPAIQEAGGSLPGILRVTTQAPVSVRLQSVVLRPGASQQLPPRDASAPTEPAQTPGGGLGSGITEASPERPGSAEIVALLDVEDTSAELVLTIKDRGGFASSSIETELPEPKDRGPVKAAAFAVSGDLGVRQPAWAFRIGPDTGKKAPAATASADADLLAFADGAEALVVVYVTFEKAP